MTKRRFRFPSAMVLTLAALAVALAGCSNGQKPVVPVRGKVLYRGQPADGALVVFNPVGENDPKAVRPQGTVGRDGAFEMATYDEKDGAPPGEYDVSIVWLIENEKTKKVWSPLPARYMAPEQSGLRVTVREGDNDLPPFQLTTR